MVRCLTRLYVTSCYALVVTARISAHQLFVDYLL